MEWRAIGTGTSRAQGQMHRWRPATGTHRHSGGWISIANTLHLPSIKVGSETNYRLNGVFGGYPKSLQVIEKMTAAMVMVASEGGMATEYLADRKGVV